MSVVRRRLFPAALVLFALTGCGGERAEQSPREELEGVLSSFGDQASNPKTLGVYFAGTAPDAKALKGYQSKSFRVADEPRMSGNTATAGVIVTDEEKGEELGTVEWKFVKVGDRWKLESAPLP
jgi:hypothetical protein